MQKMINRGHVSLGHKNLNKGFTLIELLVVIAIIGILAGIVLASLGNARSNAGDAKVKEQLSSIRNAMESYYSSNNAYGTGAGAASDGCSVAAPSAAPWNDTNTGLAVLANESNYSLGSGGMTCYATTSQWAVSAQLKSGNWSCVDYRGIATTTGVNSNPLGTTGDTLCDF